ncbi:response regulator transcription factor [Lentzea sp. JNUCC 0626]|uniref:response regulator transcription factor n=1 Tax=Lentzea sp. JNUCC 0626 TaxID=3367513 RepID=UPI003747C226
MTSDVHPGQSQAGAMAVTVLLVEDDPLMSDAMSRRLRGIGYRLRVASSVPRAVRMISGRRPDLVVLDLGLPDLDGQDALRVIRDITSLSVVIATGVHDELGIVRTLNAGADDYLAKPFSLEHLAARMRAVLRRSCRIISALPVLTIGGLRVDRARREATVDGRLLELNRKEFDVLTYLAERADRVVSRKEVAEAVWGRLHRPGDQCVDVHLSWLRRKLGESASRPRYLHTVRGVGVRLADSRTADPVPVAYPV